MLVYKPYNLYILKLCLYLLCFVGPQVGRMKRSQRQAELKKKYFFECTCPACSRYVKIICISYNTPSRVMACIYALDPGACAYIRAMT